MDGKAELTRIMIWFTRLPPADTWVLVTLRSFPHWSRPLIQTDNPICRMMLPVCLVSFNSTILTSAVFLLVISPEISRRGNLTNQSNVRLSVSVGLSALCEYIQSPEYPAVMGWRRRHLACIFYVYRNTTSVKQNFDLMRMRRAAPPTIRAVSEDFQDYKAQATLGRQRWHLVRIFYGSGDTLLPALCSCTEAASQYAATLYAVFYVGKIPAKYLTPGNSQRDIRQRRSGKIT